MGRRFSLGLVALTFGAFYLASAGGRLYVNDSYVKLQSAYALYERGNLAIPGHGSLTAISPADGRTYSKFEVLHSILFLPAVAFGQLLAETGAFPLEKRWLVDAALASLLGPISAALTVVFFFLWARSLFRSDSGAIRAALLLGVATMLWPYSKRCWTEVPQTAFLTAGGYLIHRARASGSGRSLLLAGLALGAAISLRVTGAVLLPLYAAPLFLSRWERPAPLRRAVLFSAGILVLVLPLVLGANWIRFGHPLSLFQWRMGGFSTNFITGLFGLLASPGESLFLYSPILLAAAAYLPRLRAIDGDAFRFALFAPILLVLLYASWWFHAYTWGPRFLLPALPFLALPLAAPPPSRRAARWAFAALLATSIGLQALGVFLHLGDLPELEKPLHRHGLLPPGETLTRGDTWFHPLRTRAVAHLLAAGESAGSVLRGESPPLRPDLWPFALRDDLGLPLRYTLPIEAALGAFALAGFLLLLRRARGTG